MARIVAILNSGDWYDASVDHLEIPDSMDLEEERIAWRDWCKNIIPCSNKYHTFVEFLKSHGAIESDKIETFEEY